MLQANVGTAALGCPVERKLDGFRLTSGVASQPSRLPGPFFWFALHLKTAAVSVNRN